MTILQRVFLRIWAIQAGLTVTLAVAQTTYEPYTVSAFVGASSVGSADGVALEARFNQADSVATDSAGNVYVADRGSCTIRKISPLGVVSTFAGQAGVAGLVNGSGATARFSDPAGIAVGSDGAVYVLDGGEVLRKISPAGDVSTLAQLSLSVYWPMGNPVVDDGGNVYVADNQRHTVVKITADGTQISIFAGASGSLGSTDGLGGAARFSGPNDLGRMLRAISTWPIPAIASSARSHLRVS